MKSMRMTKPLALIPARGGSRRLPRKNVRDFLGKPLVAWTIEAVHESDACDRCVVVTDDQEIADIALQYGAEVPFLEPPELATDTAYIDNALRYVLERFEGDGYTPSCCILLEPTAIGRDAQHIRDAARIIEERAFDSLAGVSEVPAHFSHRKQLQLGNQSALSRVGDGAKLKDLVHRNQDIGVSYYVNSAIYAFQRGNLFRGENSLWGESTYGYVMDSRHLADIDTQEDWDIAEFKMRRKLALRHAGQHTKDRM